MRKRKTKRRKAAARKAFVAVATAAVVAGAEIVGKEKPQHVQVQQAEQPAALTYAVNSTNTATVLVRYGIELNGDLI